MKFKLFLIEMVFTLPANWFYRICLTWNFISSFFCVIVYIKLAYINVRTCLHLGDLSCIQTVCVFCSYYSSLFMRFNVFKLDLGGHFIDPVSLYISEKDFTASIFHSAVSLYINLFQNWSKTLWFSVK